MVMKRIFALRQNKVFRGGDGEISANGLRKVWGINPVLVGDGGLRHYYLEFS